MKFFLLFIAIITGLCSCLKDRGTNPDLAYSDKALLDSCKKEIHRYAGGKKVLLPALGPHGEHFLRFNSIAYGALDTGFHLPVGRSMPNGSMIIKDTYKNKVITLYSFMYKRSGSWLWAEIEPAGNILYSVHQDPSVCIGCHSGAGNRDQVLSFK